jgi:hypothetical protein
MRLKQIWPLIFNYTEAIAKRWPLTSQAAYDASRISCNLKGSTKQFGWLQASATTNCSVPVTSEYPATIRFDKMKVALPVCQAGGFEFGKGTLADAGRGRGLMLLCARTGNSVLLAVA